MSLEGIGRIYERRPENVPVGHEFDPASPYERSDESDDGLPSQAMVIQEQSFLQRIGDDDVEWTDIVPEVDEGAAGSDDYGEELGDDLYSRVIEALAEEPHPIESQNNDDSSPKQADTFGAQPALEVAIEPAAPDPYPDTSSTIGESAVALWMADSPEFAINLRMQDEEPQDGLYSDDSSDNLPTATPEESPISSDFDVVTDAFIIPVERAGGIGDVMGSFRKTDVSEAMEYGDPLDVGQPETRDETGKLADRHPALADANQLELTDVQEIRHDPEVLSREAIDQATAATVFTPPRNDYKAGANQSSRSTTAPDFHSPISTPGRTRSAWVQRLAEEHGDLPLFGLLVSEVRTRKAEARQDVHVRYKVLTQGLPGIWSGFAYRLPFEARRDEFFRRVREMKKQDRAARGKRRR